MALFQIMLELKVVCFVLIWICDGAVVGENLLAIFLDSILDQCYVNCWSNYLMSKMIKGIF